MNCFTFKPTLTIGLVLLLLCAGQAIALDVNAGAPQVVAMHDVTDPNVVDPNLLDPVHPAWPMAFSTNPNSPLGPIPVEVTLNGSHDAPTPVTINWSVTDTTQASQVTIDDVSILTPNVTFTEPNLYSLTLTVDDGTGVVTDTVLIKVKLAENALQAHWKFDGDPNDPNDYDWNYTTYTGSPDFGPGLVGDAIILKKEDSISYGKGIGAETSISVAFWMKPSSGSSDNKQGVVRKYSGTSSDPQGGWTFQLRSETEMRWRCSSGWDGGAGDQKVTDSFPVDTWSHIVGTLDGTSGDMAFYLNGILMGTDSSSDTSFDSFIDEMTIGSNNFAGMIDDVYLFDYPLDVNEVIAIVTKGKRLPPVLNLESEQVKILQPVQDVQVVGTIEGEGTYTVVWTVEDKPDGTTVTFSDPDIVATKVQVDSPGNYRLHVTVTDQEFPELSDSHIFVIKARPADFDGLEAHITFDDQTADSNLPTSVSYIGTLFGDPVWDAGLSGDEGDFCVLLDGVDDHINYEDAFLGSDPCCTIAFWIGDDAVDVQSHIIQKFSNDTSGKGWLLRHRPTDNPGEVSPLIGSSFATGQNFNNSGGYIPPVDWTHLAMTFEGGVCSLYMNGIQFFSQTIDPEYSVDDLLTPMVIGYRWNNDTRFFTGAIDEVRIYDYALSSDELRPIVAEGINVAPEIKLATDQIKILQPENEVQIVGTIVEEDAYTTTWEVVEKPAGAIVTFGNPNVLETTVQLDLVGNYRLLVTVTEEGDSPLSDSAEMVVKVRPPDYDGLEAHLTFNDKTANSNLPTSVPYVGELFGNPTWTEGIGGTGDSAILLDGIDDHINFDAYIGSDPCCTIALWVSRDDDDGSHIIQKWPSNASGKGWLIRDRPDDAPGNIAIMIGSGFSGGAYDVTDAIVPAVAWTHLALTFDGLNVNVYMDGSLVFTDIVENENFSPGDLVTPMVIGYRMNNESRFYQGAIDEVRIYDHALTPEALLALYQADGGE